MRGAGARGRRATHDRRTRRHDRRPAAGIDPALPDRLAGPRRHHRHRGEPAPGLPRPPGGPRHRPDHPRDHEGHPDLRVLHGPPVRAAGHGLHRGHPAAPARPHARRRRAGRRPPAGTSLARARRVRRRAWMLHAVLITLHATTAVLCFGFGAATLLAHATTRSRQSLFRYYLTTLVAMIVFLVGAILAHVAQLDGTQRAVFLGLFVLSLYMLFRGFQARAVLFSRRDDQLGSYIHHIGFTLISLFEGFIIVAAIDLGAPGWLTAGAAVLGVIVGSRVLHRIQTRWNHPVNATS